MDEILWYDYSNESSVTSTVLSLNGTIYLVCSSSNFDSVDEILWCDHSNLFILFYLPHNNNYKKFRKIYSGEELWARAV